MAAMSAVEVRDRLADRFRLLQGSTPGPERQLTLRHAVEWSYDLLTDDERDLLRADVGVRRRLRPGEHRRRRRRTATTSTCSGISTRWCASRSSSPTTRRPRTRYRLFETIRQFAEDRLGGGGRARARRATGTPRTSPARPPRGGSSGTGPAGATPSTGSRPSSATCAPRTSGAPHGATLEVATDIAAHAALMGFSVQLFETLAWAEELLDARDRRRRPPTPPPVHRAPATRASPDGPRPAATHAHRATELEDDARYDACEPGYASFVEALCAGLLRRPRSLRRAHRRRRATLRAATGATASPSYVDGLQSAAGSRRRSRSPRSRSPPRGRSATRTGSRTRSGSRAWRSRKADARRAFAAWDEGVAFVREHRVQFFEGFLARDAARLHTSDGEPEAALVLFAEAITAFQRAGNVPQLIITLASVPALFERLDRLAAGGDAARRTVAASRRASTTSRSSPTLGERVATRLGRDAGGRADDRGRRARPATTRRCTHGSRSTSRAATPTPRRAKPGRAA